MVSAFDSIRPHARQMSQRSQEEEEEKQPHGNKGVRARLLEEMIREEAKNPPLSEGQPER